MQWWIQGAYPAMAPSSLAIDVGTLKRRNKYDIYWETYKIGPLAECLDCCKCMQVFIHMCTLYMYVCVCTVE